jgi:hypothetical protein
MDTPLRFYDTASFSLPLLTALDLISNQCGEFTGSADSGHDREYVQETGHQVAIRMTSAAIAPAALSAIALRRASASGT